MIIFNKEKSNSMGFLNLWTDRTDRTDRTDPTDITTLYPLLLRGTIGKTHSAFYTLHSALGN
jgi:hypothetical protein